MAGRPETALARVTTSVVPEVIAPKLAEYRETRDYLASYVVDDDATYIEAQEFLDRLGVEMKQFEADKKKHTKPSYDAWQNELAAYSEPTKLLKEAIARLKGLVGDYALKRAKDESLALQKAADEADAEAIEQTTDTPKGAASVRLSYTFRVVDPRLVPDQFCVKTVNLRLVELAVEEGARSIPGIEIYPKADVRRVGKRTPK